MTSPRPPSPRSDDDANQKCEREQSKRDYVIDALNALHTRHGFLNDEFLTL